MSKSQKIKVFLPMVFSVVLILGMYLGAKLKGTNGTTISMSNKGGDDNKIQQLLDYVRLRYVDSIGQDELMKAGIEGVLKHLDPHSVYIPPKKYKRSQTQLSGKFEGIGIEFFIVNDTIMVVTPLSGGPSDELGIQAGDKIVRIEGDNVAGVGMTNRDVIDSLRGPKGTKVDVSIKRPGMDELLHFTITRDKIPLHSLDVAYMVDDSTGYIKLNRFSATTYKEFRKALAKLKKQGMQQLLFDLRDNPGGYMGAAVRIADEFLSSDQMIVYTEGRHKPRQEFNATGRGNFHRGDLAVLINRGSASASEIIAGALQDWARGKVVGRRSFGKGLVQEQYMFDDSSAIRLTVARYFTPAGRSIQKPYKEGSFRDYYHEIIERFKKGELLHKDSIEHIDSLRYESPAGKVVYGGGGIMPDIFVPADTTGQSKFLYHARRKRLIPQFSYSYVSNHREEIEGYGSARSFHQNFTIDEPLMNEFLDYCEQHNLNKKPGDDTEDLKTFLKAFMAKQVWGSEGQYLILNQMDKTFRKAYESI